MIRFPCPHCGAKLQVSDAHAGKEGRCPHCRGRTTVPPAPEALPPVLVSGTGTLKDAGPDLLDTALLDLPPKGAGPKKATGQCPTADDAAEDLQIGDGHGAGPEVAAPVEPPGWPWPLDLILYPLDGTGLMHLGGLWLLLFYLCPFIMSLGLGTEYVPFVYTLPVAYALYYLAECLRQRAGGGRHVPAYWMHPGDSSKWDCFTQMFEVVGCIAVCFWPVSVYYIVRERVDWIYWLLLAGGGFFFPMVLLGVVLFDSLSALNPILIGGSILRTFLPYSGTVLFLWGLALLSAGIGFRINGFYPLPTERLLLWLVQLYLIFVALALLGDFYRRHQDRLDWAA